MFLSRTHKQENYDLMPITIFKITICDNRYPFMSKKWGNPPSEIINKTSIKLSPAPFIGRLQNGGRSSQSDAYFTLKHHLDTLPRSLMSGQAPVTIGISQ